MKTIEKLVKLLDEKADQYTWERKDSIFKGIVCTTRIVGYKIGLVAMPRHDGTFRAWLSIDGFVNEETGWKTLTSIYDRIRPLAKAPPPPPLIVTNNLLSFVQIMNVIIKELCKQKNIE